MDIEPVDYQALIEVNFVIVKLKDQITTNDKFYVAEISCIIKNCADFSKTIEVDFLKPYRSHKDTFIWSDMKWSVVYLNQLHYVRNI